MQERMFQGWRRGLQILVGRFDSYRFCQQQPEAGYEWTQETVNLPSMAVEVQIPPLWTILPVEYEPLTKEQADHEYMRDRSFLSGNDYLKDINTVKHIN